jgi:hypothetical protein
MKVMAARPGNMLCRLVPMFVGLVESRHLGIVATPKPALLVLCFPVRVVLLWTRHPQN